MYGRASIPRDVLWKVRCFLAQFAEQCRTCLRRSVENCMDCADVNRAKELISILDRAESMKAESSYRKDPVDARMDLIVRAIAEAGKPIPSKSIRIEGLTKTVKCWTLKKMCRMGILGSVADESGRTSFYLTTRTMKRMKKGNSKWHST